MISTQSKLHYLFSFLTFIAIFIGAYWIITDPTWTYEAVGGYFGGVLGGLSVLILVTSSYFQQKRDHDDDVMRRYELLYNDITGCSAQLMYHLSKEKFMKDRLEKEKKTYGTMKEQFEKGDRSVFLRFLKDEENKLKEMAKDKTKVRKSKVGKSIDRYETMCKLIFVGNSGIVKTLEETDIGIVYKILKKATETAMAEKGQEA